MIRALAVLLAASLTLLATGRALGHPLAPIVLQLTEGANGMTDATLKEPTVRPRGATYVPIWPDGCVEDEAPRQRFEDDARVTAFRLRCGPLVGASLGLDGLGASTGVLRLTLADGRTHRALLDERQPTITIPAASPPSDVVLDYAALGLRHLLAGLDHLLFILGLMALIRGRRQIVIALTSFTVGHSVTLGAAVLGIARLPTGPVELGIALSLVILGLRVADATTSPATPPSAHPWLFAFGFGLLHGFGFAGGLMEAGFPSADVPLALLGFNLGVELGQLLVALVAWLAVNLARRLPRAAFVSDAKRVLWLRLAPGYLIGSLAAMWCLERAVDWLA